MAKNLSPVLNRQIVFFDTSPEAMYDNLLRVGLPVWQADKLIEEYARYRRNEAAVISSGIQNALLRFRKFEIFVYDYAKIFN